ncbi:MAG: hypothetical protein OXT09_11775 [Myxococcales bacterium]|nr:hypothetical protein [Myxococcales bacterium]
MGAAGATLLVGCGDCGDAEPDEPAGDAGPDAGPLQDGGSALDGGLDAGQDAAVDAATPPMDDVFDVYRQLRDVLRQSPDHLPARARALVEAGDPEAIFEFVRDQIRVYPTGVYNINGQDLFTRRHFGTRATLHGGAGSFRDKVELLRELYAQADIEATVVHGVVREEHRDLRSWLLQPIERSFDPPADADTVAAWMRTLGIDAGATAELELDADRAQSEPLASALEALVRDDLSGFDWDFRWPEALPLLELTVVGETTHACPLIPGAPFGDPCADTVTPLDATQASEEPTVTVRLEAVNSAQPTLRIPLAEGSWPLEEVAARQVIVELAPAMDTRDYLQSSIEQVQTFAPVLAVQQLDDGEPPATPAVGGAAITRSGNRVEVDDSGRVLVNGLAVHDPDAPGPEPDTVTELGALQVDAGRFVSVSVRFTPTDADGSPVEGLRADAFVLEEEGEPVPFLLTANSGRPRVLVLIDQSGSMPIEWSSLAMQTAFVDGLTTRVRADYPGAIIDLRQDADSNLWGNLAEATHSEPTVIVYVTDGDVADTRTPEVVAALGSGPPAVLVHVGARSGLATLEEMATLTGGVVSSADGYAQAHDAVAAFVAAQVTPSYVLSYRASTAGPATREVTLSLAGADLSVSGSYDVPAASTSLDLVGLYLTVEHDGQSVTRTLAGFPHNHESGEPVPEDAPAQVLSLFYSDIVVDVAAATPPLSVQLDELLTARLGLEPLYDATLGDDSDAIVDALRAGVPRRQGDLVSLHPPMDLADDGASLHYLDGPRFTIGVSGPLFGTNRFGRRLDVLPLNPPSTFTEATMQGRPAQTLHETARLAVGEGTLHGTSTHYLLDGQPLVHVPQGSINHFDGNDALDDTQRTTWRRLLREYGTYRRVAPESGDPIAMWVVEPVSGALLGVLENASGGAETYVAIEQTFAEIMTIVEYIQELKTAAAVAGIATGGAGGALSGFGPALSVGAFLGENLARHYGVAALVVASLAAYETPPLLKMDLFATACQTLQRLLPGGQYGHIDGTLATLIVGDPTLMCI